MTLVLDPVWECDFGNTVTFQTPPDQPFTSPLGVVIDPDEVIFAFTINGGAVTQFTYQHGTGDPHNVITKVPSSVGLYYATINTVNYSPGVWRWCIACAPVTAIGYDVTKTSARMDGVLTVKAPNFAITY